MEPYSFSALARLRSSIALRPPCFLSHLNTRPAKYQPKVGGVLSMEPSSAMAL